MPKQPPASGLTAFAQHGFRQSGESSSQIHGNCPFCNKQNHFYIGKENRAWSCKACGRAGGFQLFLRSIRDHAHTSFKSTPAIALSKDRGIALSTLRRWGVGFNPVNETYTIPVPRTDGSGGVWDLRHARIGKALRSTATCSVGLLGWDRLNVFDEIWLCEGEWDGMIIDEVLRALKITTSGIAAVPGAGTFKTDWYELFDGKRVIVCYDNDGPGKAGALKIYNALQSRARSLQFIHWNEKKVEGYDVRDYYQDQGRKAKQTYNGLCSLLKPFPPGVETKNISAADASGAPSGEGYEAAEVYARYRKWLHMPDTSVIDAVYGTIIANRLSGDPLWLFVVGPPGDGKTEQLMAISDAHNVVTMTCLTPATLISGATFAGGGDPSLLARFHKTYDKVLIVKDFTTILNMNQQAREEIFGILRDVYDGKIEKPFGNGITRKYDTRFGIIAGVTPAIEGYIEDSAALGERFLGFRTKGPQSPNEQRDYLKKARSNVGSEDKMRKFLSDTGKETLAYDFAGAGIPIVNADVEDRLLCAALFTAHLRGSVARDTYTKEVKRRPFVELGTRLVKQYTKFALGVAMFRRQKHVGEHEYGIVKHLARGTVPSTRLRFVDIFWRHRDCWLSEADASEEAGMPKYPTGERIINDLEMLGILTKQKGSKFGSKNEFQLHPEMREVIEVADVCY